MIPPCYLVTVPKNDIHCQTQASWSNCICYSSVQRGSCSALTSSQKTGHRDKPDTQLAS